ncbi:FAD-binding domain-containing protein [Bimuria novae-zelandiae CBS 107.79]|uniref:FAD-binding domain-containing protein n=1 Tax=Bimuria novae-zelandiae CBS 107.79 TaxID=1447943 RepID=A0A6A5UUJ9_9PLEO|nr:FAD-binding domain-containing protein [Bimuria novae-zelandiae CBS 107.79]
MRLLCPVLCALLQSAVLNAGSIAHVKRQSASPEVARDLVNILSPNAAVIVPEGPTWNSSIARGSNPRISPGYRISVEVATEEEVGATVNYANQNGIDFLVVSGGHGGSTTLNRLRDGIQIHMRQLNSVTVLDDETALVGGGTLQWELISQLYPHGRRAVTGLCEYVSVIGPLLGAGHSLLQSQYGFALDGLVSVNVVLANGTATQASSITKEDLFWAIRGAGHNFGVITSYTVRTHPITSTWSLYTFFYTEEQIDTVFSLVNGIDSPPATRDPKFFLLGWIVSPGPKQAPLVQYSLACDGAASELETRAAPFLALNPITANLTTNVTHADIHRTLGAGRDIYACSKGTNQAMSGISLSRYNTAGVHKAYTLATTMSADPRFPNSAVLLENYGMDAVREVDTNAMALAPEERERPILATPLIHYVGDDEDTKAQAAVWLKDLTDALYEGVAEAERHAYVNYATGNESVPEIYGREEWRLERLRGLKQTWDPENKFRFFLPLVE